MVAINGRQLLRRWVGILRNQYNRCLTKFTHEKPTTLGFSSSFVRTSLKRPFHKAAPVSPETASTQAAPDGKVPRGRKQGRVKRKQYSKLAEDNSTIFVPGGFRNGPIKRKILHRDSKRNLQSDCEPGSCDSAAYEARAGQASQDRCARRANDGAANEHEAFVVKQLESLMFDKLKRESQFNAKVISERVKRQTTERKEAMEAERLWRMEELERREEKERVNRWKDRRLAQLEREKLFAENDLARERTERRESRLRWLFKEQQQRHRHEGRWKEMRGREVRLAAEREANLLRENVVLERGLRATDNAFRRACNERNYMIREKEEERTRRLRAEETLRRWKELMKEYLPGGQQQQPQQAPSLEAQFELYEKKWEVLRSGVDIDGTKVHRILFSQIPWPVINVTPTEPSQIQPEHILEFLMHLLREKPDASGRRQTARVKARDELKKWHPDKFDQIILSKVREEDKIAASEVARMIIRILSDMLS